jgi:phytoene dehydrogenase-like protein
VKRDTPVVVIGAGLGGLCSAAYLARAGLPVTVVERRPKVGGYASSFQRGRFVFSVSLHGSTFKGEALQNIFEDLDIRTKLELAPLPELYRHLGGTVDLVVPQHDPEAYIDLLTRHFPHETRGIRRFVATLLDIIEETNKLQRGWGKIFKPFFPFRYPQMWRWREATLAQMIAAFVEDPQLANLLGGLWSYFGLPPAKLSAFYYAAGTGEYLKYGSYYTKPRSGRLSHLLEETVREGRGRIITGVSVTHIHTEDDRVAAVSLSDGRRIASETVISNISPQVMMARMLPEPLKEDPRMQHYRRHRPSLSAFIVWLGLHRPLPPELQGAEYHINLPDGPEAEYEAALAGDVRRGAFIITLYDNILPDYSPPEAATLSVLFLSGYDPWRCFSADYARGLKTTYEEEKQRWTEILIQRAEKWLFPGLSTAIEVIATATPLTFERYTGHPEGAIYGYEQVIDNAFIKRVTPRTPITGLYLSGAWSFPGGGFPGVLRSGQAVYQAVMADLGLKAKNG